VTFDDRRIQLTKAKQTAAGLTTERLTVTAKNTETFVNFVTQFQCWANPNRDWDLNRDLSVFWEWFDNFWE